MESKGGHIPLDWTTKKKTNVKEEMTTGRIYNTADGVKQRYSSNSIK